MGCSTRIQQEVSNASSVRVVNNGLGFILFFYFLFIFIHVSTFIFFILDLIV